MATIAPFRHSDPPKNWPRSSFGPYDVLNTTEARIVADKNPDSFLHITKAEIDLPESTDRIASRYIIRPPRICSFSAIIKFYRKMKSLLLYLSAYHERRKQTGLVCVSSVDDYENNIIKKHELTRPDKEFDRINHMKIIGAQTGNVFLAYKTNVSLRQLISNWKETHESEYDFVADDEVDHRVWVVDDRNRSQNHYQCFRNRFRLPILPMGITGPPRPPKSEMRWGSASPDADYFLTTLFPSDQLRIMDYNRLVKDLNGLDEGISWTISKRISCGKVDNAFSPVRLHEFGMYLEAAGIGWWRKNSFSRRSHRCAGCNDPSR